MNYKVQIVKFSYDDLLKTLNKNYYLWRKRRKPGDVHYDYYIIKIGFDSKYITKVPNGDNLYSLIRKDDKITLKYVKDTWDEQIIIIDETT